MFKSLLFLCRIYSGLYPYNINLIFLHILVSGNNTKTPHILLLHLFWILLDQNRLVCLWRSIYLSIYISIYIEASIYIYIYIYIYVRVCLCIYPYITSIANKLFSENNFVARQFGSDISMFTHILLNFSKTCVVHQIEKIF